MCISFIADFFNHLGATGVSHSVRKDKRLQPLQPRALQSGSLKICFTFLMLATLVEAAWAQHKLSSGREGESYIAPASDDSQLAIKRIQPAAGLKVDLWAAEPMLANPVSFCFDEKGRVYLCETFRLGAGVG